MPGIKFNPILTPPAGPIRQNTAGGKAAGGTSFSDILDSTIDEGVRFSKHAQARLESRGIGLDDNDLKKLGGAVDAAASKGVQDSLILMNGLALIVSVKDRTVVTAMPVGDADTNVFTNIDGAVIA